MGGGVSGVYCQSYLEVGWWGEWGLLSLIFRGGVVGLVGSTVTRSVSNEYNIVLIEIQIQFL